MAWDQEHIDTLAAKFVLEPARFDVVVASNLFGDILSDLAAAVAGSIGIAPAANLNPEREFPSMFEPVHGSAPDIAGQGIARSPEPGCPPGRRRRTAPRPHPPAHRRPARAAASGPRTAHRRDPRRRHDPARRARPPLGWRHAPARPRPAVRLSRAVAASSSPV